LASDDLQKGAPAEGRLSPLARIWGWVVDGLGALGTLMIGVLMAIICADIFARNVTGGSLPLVSELGALMVVMIVALQLATTVRADRLARTEVFWVPFRARFPRAGAVLSALFDAAGAALLGLAAWASVDILMGDIEAGEFIGTPGLGTLPTWPFRALIVTGLAVAALQFAFRALAALREAAGGKGQAA
jgi:TRAP-type C4-dicarboxylate transport system permease small subunit